MCGLNADAFHGANGGGVVIHSAGEKVKLYGTAAVEALVLFCSQFTVYVVETNL